jgi:hypothetical protein
MGAVEAGKKIKKNESACLQESFFRYICTTKKLLTVTIHATGVNIGKSVM